MKKPKNSKPKTKYNFEFETMQIWVHVALLRFNSTIQCILYMRDFLMTDSEINKIKEIHNKRFVLNHFKKNFLVGFLQLFATHSTKSRKPFSIRMLDSHDYFPLFCLVMLLLECFVICNCCLEEAGLPFCSIFAFNGVTLQHHLKWNCMNAYNRRNILMRKCKMSYSRIYILSPV